MSIFNDIQKEWQDVDEAIWALEEENRLLKSQLKMYKAENFAYQKQVEDLKQQNTELFLKNVNLSTKITIG